MHKIPDTLGDVIKEARQNKSITIESLAEKLDVTVYSTRVAPLARVF